jgi:hypothetical protein
MASLLHSLTYSSVIFSQNNETNSSAGEKTSSKIISMVIFYEQSQRGRNLVTQVWCLVYLSVGFHFSFHLMSGTCAGLPVTSGGFTTDYSYLSCLPPMIH